MYFNKRKITLNPFYIGCHNGFCERLYPKRKLTLRECKHILRDILGIDLCDKNCFDSYEDYENYNKDICSDVNLWINGDDDDYCLMRYAGDCSSEALGVKNMINILIYLQKRKII